jgi:hypothetical protein
MLANVGLSAAGCARESRPTIHSGCGKERVFHLVRRRDPVLCANNDRRRIEIVKREFRDVAREFYA